MTPKVKYVDDVTLITYKPALKAIRVGIAGMSQNPLSIFWCVAFCVFWPTFYQRQKSIQRLLAYYRTTMVLLEKMIGPYLANATVDFSET